MTMGSAAGRRRWICAALLIVAMVCVCNGDAHVNAETLAVSEVVEATQHEETTPQEVTTTTTKVKITRTRVAATIETTAQVNEVERLPGIAMEQCSVGDAQCAEAPADALPEPLDEELQQTDDDPENDFTTTTTTTATTTAHASVLALPLEVASRHLEEMQTQVREWLPHVKQAAATVAAETTAAWESLVAAWRALYSECVFIYDRFFAEAVATLLSFYRQAAAVGGDVYAVVSAWVAVVVDEGRELWQTHEEVRIVTRHFVAAIVLAAFAALFFSLYAVAATVPDAVVTLWTSLDDLTRAQLKIVAVLVLSFVVYQLRVMWSFWLLLVAIAGFYYWSGHVVAKSTTPLQRQASRDLPAQPISQGKAKLH